MDSFNANLLSDEGLIIDNLVYIKTEDGNMIPVPINTRDIAQLQIDATELNLLATTEDHQLPETSLQVPLDATSATRLGEVVESIDRPNESGGIIARNVSEEEEDDALVSCTPYCDDVSQVVSVVPVLTTDESNGVDGRSGRLLTEPDIPLLITGKVVSAKEDSIAPVREESTVEMPTEVPLRMGEVINSITASEMDTVTFLTTASSEVQPTEAPPEGSLALFQMLTSSTQTETAVSMSTGLQASPPKLLPPVSPPKGKVNLKVVEELVDGCKVFKILPNEQVDATQLITVPRGSIISAGAQSAAPLAVDSIRKRKSDDVSADVGKKILLDKASTSPPRRRGRPTRHLVVKQDRGLKEDESSNKTTLPVESTPVAVDNGHLLQNCQLRLIQTGDERGAIGILVQDGVENNALATFQMDDRQAMNDVGRHGEGGATECTICGKKLSRAFLLKAHMNIHTGERPFKCDFPGCERAFADKSNLRQHLKIHKVSEERWICPKCNRSFAQKRYMKKHLETHNRMGTIIHLSHQGLDMECANNSRLESPLQNILVTDGSRVGRIDGSKLQDILVPVQQLAGDDGVTNVTLGDDDDLEEHTMLHDPRLKLLEQTHGVTLR